MRIDGAPGRTRTADASLRTAALCPLSYGGAAEIVPPCGCTIEPMPSLPDLVLYARPGCSLCDESREAIDVVVVDRRARGLAVPRVEERDIEADPELHRRYLDRIPVVELGNQRVELVVTVGKVRRLLNETFGTVPSVVEETTAS